MADVEASKAQAEQAAPQESAAPEAEQAAPQESAAPEAEQAAEQSALAKAFEQMKAKHPDAVLLFRMGDFYGSFRAGKRVAICDEPQQFTESAPKKKAARKSAKKESK